MSDWPKVILYRPHPGVLPKTIAKKPVESNGRTLETYVPLERFKAALLSDEAKAALYDAHMRYQNRDPRDMSEDGWATVLLEAALAAADEQVGGGS